MNYHDFLIYDDTSGSLIWKSKKGSGHKTWNTRFAGKIAGTIANHGYRVINLSGKKLYAHRIAFEMQTGIKPKGCIDHINGNKDDNRISNLREVSHQENNQNQPLRTNNKSGVCGVRYRGDRGKWVATIKHKYRLIFLGYFESFEKAKEAREEAEAQYGFHRNHGRKAA